jgi:hypothetical protein
VSPTAIFWASQNGDEIGRASLDGTGKNLGLITGISPGPCSIAIDSGHIYWGTVEYLGKAPLSGISPERTWVSLGAYVPCAIAVNSANVFFGDTGFIAHAHEIGRVGTDKAGLDTSIIGEADGPCGMAVSGSRLYWANQGDGTIGAANTDATAVDEELVKTGGGEICGVAVDSLSTPFNPPPTSPPSSGPIPPPPPLGGTLKVASVKYDKKNGSARVSLKVNEAGTVSLSGKGVGAAKVKARGAETVALSVLAAKSKRPTLKRTGKLVTKVLVSFMPSDGGASATLAKGLTLREQTPHRK